MGLSLLLCRAFSPSLDGVPETKNSKNRLLSYLHGIDYLQNVISPGPQTLGIGTPDPANLYPNWRESAKAQVSLPKPLGICDTIIMSNSGVWRLLRVRRHKRQLADAAPKGRTPEQRRAEKRCMSTSKKGKGYN
jgi:hypothetical protein